MQIQLNGKPYQTEADTLITLLKEAEGSEATEGKAIAVNDEVVPSAEWQSYRLSEGDRVELVQAYQGG